jgi:hypothetical protein
MPMTQMCRTSTLAPKAATRLRITRLKAITRHDCFLLTDTATTIQTITCRIRSHMGQHRQATILFADRQGLGHNVDLIITCPNQ